MGHGVGPGDIPVAIFPLLTPEPPEPPLGGEIDINVCVYTPVDFNVEVKQ